MNEEAEALPENHKIVFNSIMAKLLFVGKRARPDLLVAIASITSRVSKSTSDDWKKLRQLLQYIWGTMEFKLTLSTEVISNIK